MSFDSLCESQPVLTVKRSATPTATDAAGLAAPGTPASGSSFRGRIGSSTASQKAMWLTLGIEADYSLVTKFAGLVNGDLVSLTDPDLGVRTFRVAGTRSRRMGDGGIESYFNYPLREVTA